MQHNSLSCFSHSGSYSHTPHYKVAAGIFRVPYRVDVTCALLYFWWDVPFSAFSFQLCSQAARLCCGFVMLQRSALHTSQERIIVGDVLITYERLEYKIMCIYHQLMRVNKMLKGLTVLVPLH